MASKIAKLILEHADSFLERAEAVDVALSLGMTLDEIQDYLDWVDSMHGGKAKQSSNPSDERVQHKNSAPADGNLPLQDSEEEPQDTKANRHKPRQAGNSD